MTHMNKLYLVCSTSKCLTGRGYDTYDSFIVCCKTEDEARRTHPSGTHRGSDDRTWVREEELNLLDVECIGNANDNIEVGVVLASFNAG